MFKSTATTTLALAALLPALVSAQYTATYTYGSLPDSSEGGQSGTNKCGTTAHQDSMCQNAFVNNVDDFCVWGPPGTSSPEGDGTNKIGNIEQIVVSYCLKDGYGTRLLPAGTLTSAHFVKVVNSKVSYVQVTGVGDFTKILIPAGDDGGELDPHSWTGLGNPQGGLVFTNAFSGQMEQTHEWTSFMSANSFCIRACKDGPNAAGYCEHIYDVLSCDFTIPGDFSPGFDSCLGDPTDEAPGVYGGSTFHQGDPSTPAGHPPGKTSQCTPYSTIGGGSANIAAVTGAANGTSASASITGSTNATASGSMSSVTSTSVSGSGSASGSGISRISSTTAAPSGSGTAGNAGASASSSSTSKSGAGRNVVENGIVMMAGAVGAMVFGAGALLL